MAVSDSALRAVGANAVRHLLEADQHYKARRYPSATTSAVLSIEESGKLGFLAGTDSAPKVPGRLKHGMHAAPFLAFLEALSPSNMATKWRAMLREGSTSNLTPKQQQIIADHPEVAEFVHRVQAGELPDPRVRVEAWAAAMSAMKQRDGTLKKEIAQFTAALQPLRLNATYVDVAESGDVSSEPDVNNPGLSEILCAGAIGMLTVMLALTASERETFDANAVAESITEDLAGMAMLHRVFPQLTRITSARPGAIQRLFRRVDARKRAA